jgi:N-acetylmuramoyl-L-alanine amidase
MGFLDQRRVGIGCRVLAAIVCVGLCCGAATPWDAAVEARARFEAEPTGTHTKAEYDKVMDEFRVIYHADPGAAHAARAVEQVAELLAEQGREFHDTKSLRDAAGQYEFLAKAYPGGSVAPKAMEQAIALLGPDAADDPVEERKVRKQLEVVYPKYAKEFTPQRDPVVGSARTNTEASSLRPHEAADSGRKDKVVGVKPVLVSAPVSAEDKKPFAMVTGIRHWSTASYTRVAIDLGDQVEYQAARVENPDRIFFDLHHAKLAPQLEGKSFSVTDDGFLTKIRAAQYSDEVTRVVLDVHEVAEYSAFLLPNPYRLIIDIHGKARGGVERGAGTNTEISPLRPHEAADSRSFGYAQGDDKGLAGQGIGSANGPVVTSNSGVAVETSSLPPMPVTDGSAGFGLAPRSNTSGSAKVVVAQPRVVVSSKPTVAKPVPNTVTTHSNETGSEVAAVSEQPGKIEATRRPTSQPITSGTRVAAAGDEPYVPKSRRAADSGASTALVATTTTAKHAHVAGEPTEAALPTADGETSLVRALGLKIGRIVIDAGHGGHDSGTLGAGGIEEKDVVLDVALRLGKLLHDRLGAEIVYTRADDTFIPLETRTAIANKAQADLFISVHANSSQDPSARGIEVYYLNFTSDPDAMKVASRENAVSTQSVHELSDLVKKIALKDKIDESKELASDVDASLYAGLRKGNVGLKDRGVKKAPFVVLIGANMPSILAEISFVTNPDDAAQLETPEYRERVAESLYGGVAKYAAGINGAKVKVRTTERAAVGR